MLEEERFRQYSTGKNRRKRSKLEYSKRATTAILFVALVDIQLTYILAFMGKEIAETLSITLVTEVIAVFGIYMAKAYLGKRNEEANNLKRELESSTDSLDKEEE